MPKFCYIYIYIYTLIVVFFLFFKLVQVAPTILVKLVANWQWAETAICKLWGSWRAYFLWKFSLPTILLCCETSLLWSYPVLVIQNESGLLEKMHTLHSFGIPYQYLCLSMGFVLVVLAQMIKYPCPAENLSRLILHLNLLLWLRRPSSLAQSHHLKGESLY